MKIFIIVLLILSIPATGISQETQVKKAGHRRQRIASAREQILQLKEGALLVRLHTRKNSIEALRKLGKDKQADKLEQKQAEDNLSIIHAFGTRFNFCKTYFFYSYYSMQVNQRQLDKVVFLDKDLVEDSTIKFDGSVFLTAEFGCTEQDTAKRFSQYSLERNGEHGLVKSANYSGSPNLGISALVMKSDKFVQLRRPFPYYVRLYNTFPIKRSAEKAVKKMNKKLTRFYHRKANHS